MLCNMCMLLLSGPEMKELQKIVIPKIKAEWKTVAYNMGYKPHETDAITVECCHKLKDCCVMLFEDWLRTSHPPTPKIWQTLLDHLKQVDDLTAVMEDIEKELINCKDK